MMTDLVQKRNIGDLNTRFPEVHRKAFLPIDHNRRGGLSNDHGQHREGQTPVDE